MARSDLLVSLVRAGAAGDRREITTAVEAIIAEERAKQHNVLADRLARANVRPWGPVDRIADETIEFWRGELGAEPSEPLRIEAEL